MIFNVASKIGVKWGYDGSSNVILNLGQKAAFELNKELGEVKKDINQKNLNI